MAMKVLVDPTNYETNDLRMHFGIYAHPNGNVYVVDTPLESADIGPGVHRNYLRINKAADFGEVLTAGEVVTDGGGPSPPNHSRTIYGSFPDASLTPDVAWVDITGVTRKHVGSISYNLLSVWMAGDVLYMLHTDQPFGGDPIPEWITWTSAISRFNVVSETWLDDIPVRPPFPSYPDSTVPAEDCEGVETRIAFSGDDNTVLDCSRVFVRDDGKVLLALSATTAIVDVAEEPPCGCLSARISYALWDGAWSGEVVLPGQTDERGGFEWVDIVPGAGGITHLFYAQINLDVLEDAPCTYLSSKDLYHVTLDAADVLGTPTLIYGGATNPIINLSSTTGGNSPEGISLALRYDGKIAILFATGNTRGVFSGAPNRSRQNALWIAIGNDSLTPGWNAALVYSRLRFAPTVALIASSGNLTNGLHRYLVTYFDAANVEHYLTGLNGFAEITTDAGHQQVQLTDIPLGPPGTLGRNIYRQDDSDGDPDFWGISPSDPYTLPDNTTTTHVDNTAYADTLPHLPFSPEPASFFDGELVFTPIFTGGFLYGVWCEQSFFSDGSEAPTFQRIRYSKETAGVWGDAVDYYAPDPLVGFGNRPFLLNHKIAVISSPLSLLCPVLIGGMVGVAYSSFLVASGGTPPYTYSIIDGSLPNGLSLNPVTGEIFGTPILAGTFPFTAQVTDALEVTAEIECQISILDSPPPFEGGEIVERC